MTRVELTPSRSPQGAATPRKSFALLQSPFERVEPSTEPATSSTDASPEAKLDDQPKDGDKAKPNATPPPAANKILFLDGLRGLAAMMVIVQHASWMTDRPVGQPAVDMFFVLSAFLLTMIFEKKARTLIAERANWRRWSWALLDYFTRRFLRVYPLFFVITLVIWALPDELKQRYFVFKHPENFNVLRTLLFQFDYRYHVFWTLPLEIMYYFLIPVFVVVLLAVRKFWLLPMIPLAYLVAYSGFYWERIDHMPFKPHLPTFLCGSMAAIIYAKADQFITKRKLEFKWWSTLILRAVELWCLALLFSTLFNGLLFTWVFTNPIKPGPGGRFVSTNISVIIVCELLLPGPISSVLEWSLLRYAGKISYSMYLLHSFVLYTPWVARQSYYDRYWAIWVLSFLLSAASYHAIEYPCQWFAGRIGKAIKAKDMAEKKRMAAEDPTSHV